MRSQKKAIASLSLLLIVSIALGACGATPTAQVVEKEVTKVVQETVIVPGTPQVIEKEVVVTATPEPKKKILYLSTSEVPQQLNTFLSDSSGDAEPQYYVNCLLGRFAPDGTVVPYAATWDQSADGLTFTFHINKDAKWHDGEPLTAKDVVFTYKLVATQAAGSVYFSRVSGIKGAQEYYDGKATDVEGLKAIDDKTVEITLAAPSPAFLSLTQGALYLLPEHILGALSATDVWNAPYWKNPIGCGPYKWVEYVANQYVHYEKFDDFFLGTPKIDEIYLRLGTDESNALAFEKGDLDFVALAGTDMERFSKMSYPLHESQGSVQSIVVNTKRPWLENVKFRKAMLYAMDREALNNAAYFGFAQVAVNPSMTPWTLSPNVTLYPYDPTKAKQLLSEISWDGSVTFDLLVVPDATFQREAVIEQQNWADVGIKVNLVTMEAAQATDLMVAGTYDMMMQGFGSMSRTPWVAADNFMSKNLPPAGINWSWYEDPTLDALFEQALTEMDPTRLKETFYKITERMTDQVPMLPEITDPVVVALSPRVVIPNLAYVERNRPGINTWLTWNVYEWDITE